MAAWPSGPGEMARRIRQHAWEDTPLGPIETWPPNLRTAVDICLGLQFPCALLWGPSCTLIQNDATVLNLNGIFAGALGRPASEALPGRWPMLAEPVQQVIESGFGLNVANLAAESDQGDGGRDAHLPVSFSPVHDECGVCAGVLMTAIETIERKRGLLALQDSERWLRQALDAGRMASWLWDQPTDCLDTSDSMGMLLGLSSDRRPRTRAGAVSLIHPDDRLQHQQMVADVGLPAGGWQAEYRVVRPNDGMIVWLEERAEIIEGARSGPLRIAGVVWDITERKQAEVKLCESRGRYRSFFESIHQGFCAIEVMFDDAGHGVDYRFLDVNPAFERVTGLAGVVGRRMRDLVPAHEAHWYRVYGEVVRTQTPARFEAGVDALGRWFDVYAYPAGGRASQRVDVLFEDITARKHACLALRASEARFRAVASVVPNIPRENEDDGTALWYNDRWYGHTGLPESDPGEAWMPVVRPDERNQATDRLARNSAPGDEMLQQAVCLRGANGPCRWFLTRTEPVCNPVCNDDGAIVSWAGAPTGVHEERMVREQLEARIESATAALRSLSRQLITVQEEERRYLARELHDEIGQALTGLALTLSTASTNDAKLDEARRIVAELTEQVRQLSMDLRPAALDAYGLLAAVRSHLQRYESRTGIMVELRAEGMDRRFSAPIEIAAYRVVQEALTNLARYARVTSGVVQLFAVDDSLFISIRDDGVGMDLASIEAGSGIGGMRERIEFLGGSFEFESHPGDGVRITVELPIGAAFESNECGAGDIGNAP